MKRSLFVCLLLCACEGPLDQAITPAPATPVTTPIAPPAPVALVTAEELPVPEDYAAEAEEQITGASYSAELDALAREIEADLP